MSEVQSSSAEFSSQAPNIAQALNRLPELEELYQRFLINPSDPEARAAVKQAEEQMPAIDAMSMAIIGIHPADIIPETLHMAPFKEGKPNGSSQYQVGERPDGQQVFMKDVPALGLSKINDLRMLANAQSEVFASRLASIIGYPMPHIELVRHGDKAVLMSDYHPGNDHIPGLGLIYRGKIANPEALANRPILNALLGRNSSEADEGVIDQNTKQYHALDISLVARGQDLAITPAEMQSRLTELNNNHPFQFTEASAAYIDKLAAALQSGTLQQIFRDLIGPDELEGIKAQEIAARAHALIKLAGAFL